MTNSVVVLAGYGIYDSVNISEAARGITECVNEVLTGMALT